MSDYEERMKTADGIRTRIAEIDRDFTAATHWGSWVAEASGERKGLVIRLKKEHGIDVPHNHEMKVLRTPSEPEHVAADGSIRKDHYGMGRQPWDDIVDVGWGPAFAAGNALKYVRRHAAKNGADDLTKGRWYYNQLNRLCDGDHRGSMKAVQVLNDLDGLLTSEERSLLQDGLEA